jgi:hypothetical protein
MNSGTIYKRIKFAGDVANGNPQFMRLDHWSGWATLSTQPIERQVDGVIRDFLGGFSEAGTREVMLGTRTGTADDSDPALGPKRLKSLLSIALASPDFQRR